jgi:hypothetical protein
VEVFLATLIEYMIMHLNNCSAVVLSETVIQTNSASDCILRVSEPSSAGDVAAATVVGGTCFAVRFQAAETKKIVGWKSRFATNNGLLLEHASIVA